MTEPDNNKHHDEVIASLYQHGSVEQPSDELNKNILNAARKKSDNIIHWPAKKIFKTLLSSHSLAVAAVLVISISVILQIQFDYPEEVILPTAEQQLSKSLSPNSIPKKQNSTDVTSQMSMQPAEEILIESESQAITRDSESTIVHSPVLKAKPSVRKQEMDYKKQQALKHRHYEEIKRESKRRRHEEKKRLSEQQKLRQKQKAEYQRSESQRLSALIDSSPTSSLADNKESMLSHACEKLSNAECLASTNCILEKDNDSLICRQSKNPCEKGFVQITQPKEQCQIKPECEYISSDCHCDEHGCQCADNQPPICKPVFDDEDEDDTD